jgi:ribosomal protein S15
MALAGEAKSNVISKFRVHKSDTGSPEVQVAILSRRISELTEHFKTHNKGPSLAQRFAADGGASPEIARLPAQP